MKKKNNSLVILFCIIFAFVYVQLTKPENPYIEDKDTKTEQADIQKKENSEKMQEDLLKEVEKDEDKTSIVDDKTFAQEAYSEIESLMNVINTDATKLDTEDSNMEFLKKYEYADISDNQDTLLMEVRMFKNDYKDYRKYYKENNDSMLKISKDAIVEDINAFANVVEKYGFQ